MSKTALLALLLAAGAFGVGYVTATTTETTPTLPDDLAGDYSTSDTTSPDRANKLVGGVDAPERSGPALQSNPQADDLAPIRQAVAAYEALPLVRGDGTIAGAILTDDGGGLGGVKVSATPARVRPPMPYIDDLDERLLRSVRREIEHHQWLAANIVETTTDESGSFLLEGLQDREHHVRARREGWNIRARDWNRSRKARPGPDELPFVAKPKSGVRLELTQPDGTSISRARVQLIRQGGSARRNRSQGWTSSRPEIESNPGTYRLEVSAGEHNHLHAGGVDVEITSGEFTAVRVDLKERPVLVVTIAFPKGEETGGRFYHMPTDSGDRPTDVELTTRGEEKGMWAGAGQKPQQVIQDLKSRYVAVGFSRTRARLDAIDVIQLKDGINQHTLEIPALGAGASMKVRVFTSDGKPITDAAVSPQFTSKETGGAWGAAANRGAGEYLVVHPDGRGSGTYTLQITAPGHGRKKFEYDPGSTSVFDARFDPVAKLSLLIENVPTTAGKVMASLNLEPGRGRANEVALDADGKVAFAGTQPGTYHLQLQMGSRRGRRKVIHSQKIDLKSGERQLRIPMPELHTVTIRGATNNVSVRQQIKSKDRNARRNAYSEWKRVTDGEAVFADLPSGEYTAQSGRRRATFRLPGSTTIVLEDPK